MITVKDLHAIIKLKEAGHSDRKIATLCDIDRKTIAKYWHRHQNQLEQMKTEENKQEIQEAIVAKPSYDSSTRIKLRRKEPGGRKRSSDKNMTSVSAWNMISEKRVLRSKES